MLEPLTSNPALPSDSLAEHSELALAQALAEKLRIKEIDWHRLKANRSARAREQIATALIFLLKDQPEEALPRLQQAVGWLDRSIAAPPCPSHGARSVQHSLRNQDPAAE
jgi:hypothetical protein